MIYDYMYTYDERQLIIYSLIWSILHINSGEAKLKPSSVVCTPSLWEGGREGGREGEGEKGKGEGEKLAHPGSSTP
jgi:hypothetical protein